jgi:hypothetical protein
MGYKVPMDYGLNYRVLEQKKIVNTIDKKKKQVIRYNDKLALTLPKGVKDRLKLVAKHQDRRYHTLATEYLLKGLHRAEKKMKLESIRVI